MKGYKRGQKHVRNLRLYEVNQNGNPRWRLRTPDPSGHGFRERQFSSEAEASTAFDIAYAQHMNHGLKAGNLGARERGAALVAVDILRPFGVSLEEAAKFYAAHHVNTQQSKLVKDVVAELLKAKKQDGLAPRYLKDLRNRLERFARDFGSRRIAEISVNEIETWLRNLVTGALNRNTYSMRLSVLFAFARKRRWCVENPISEVEKAKWIGAEPGILSPEEFARLLANASPETLPYWAIGGFTGLRTAELKRLEWCDIDFERQLVEVTRGKSKTGARRHVQIQTALLAWLEPFRGRQTGKICPANLRRLLLADRQRAGLTDWPSNGLRHSFASYSLEFFQQPGALCLEMGHVDQGMVARHYRRRVSPEAAKAWWSIYPPASMQNIIVEGQFKVA